MKKNPGEIKQEILNTLEQGPLSIQQISIGAKSNWLTISKFVSELMKVGKVREMTLPNNTKIYRLVREDTYLDIPITKEEKNMFYFLFDNAKRQFIEDGKKNPTKTDIQKAVVMTIDRFNLQAPSVWYLFGRMTLMKYELDKDYSTNSKPENYTEILNFLRKVIIEVIKQGSAKKVRKYQYGLYDKPLYQKKEEIYDLLILKNLDDNKKEFKKLLSEFFIFCPSTNNSIELNSLVHEFLLTIGKMAILGILENHKKQIIETFDAIWKMVALYLFFESLIKYPRFNENKERVRSLYFDDSLNNKISTARDCLSNLHSIYLDGLNEIKEPPALQDTPETGIVRDFISEMAKEGVREDEPIS